MLGYWITRILLYIPFDLVDLYIHSHIHLHGIVLNYLSTGTTFTFTWEFFIILVMGCCTVIHHDTIGSVIILGQAGLLKPFSAVRRAATVIMYSIDFGP
jgi:hypothetical protein